MTQREFALAIDDYLRCPGFIDGADHAGNLALIHHCNGEAADAGRQLDNAPATATFAVRHRPVA